LHSVRKGNGEILFSMVKMDAVSPEGNPLLPVALLRGHFVSILICLIDQETKERYFLLVKQRRVANGAWFYEHPAGMMDSDSDPYAVALTEVQEETGLTIQREALNLLNEQPLFSSPGLLDECGYFFFVELEMSNKEIMSYHEQAKGEGGEGEYITTYVAAAGDARTLIRNTSGLLAIFLYEERRVNQP
ncbi:MAG TPA: NUDIX hydrolase, partial [Bacteroidetes bacterium]|nr:NUDIX hydrolase [Bacteroidota bacterium]